MHRTLPKPLVPVLEEDMPRYGRVPSGEFAVMPEPPTEEPPRPQEAEQRPERSED